MVCCCFSIALLQREAIGLLPASSEKPHFRCQGAGVFFNMIASLPLLLAVSSCASIKEPSTPSIDECVEWATAE
uniref:Uncharacterized protein n=1 Tax=Aegilops tauschii subsp. strangulata TaxID=200361 RepID=A0A453BK27_AEGTS